MSLQHRHRDSEEERRERDRYILLLHVYTLAGAEAHALLPERRIWDDLALPESYAGPLVRSLAEAGYLLEVGEPGRIALSPRGVEYIEHLAGRRRSLRLLQ